jgi:hypothetical protein
MERVWAWCGGTTRRRSGATSVEGCGRCGEPVRIMTEVTDWRGSAPHATQFNLLGKAGFPAYAQRREGGSMPLPASPGLSSTSSFPGSIPACGQHRCGGFLTSSPASVVNARAPHSVSEISVRGDGPTFGGGGCGSVSTGEVLPGQEDRAARQYWDPSGLPCPGNEAFACDQN